MIIDLIALKESPYKFEFSLSPEDIELESDEAKIKNVVEVSGELSKRIAQIDVEGEIVADLETECSRCLGVTIEKLKFPFSAGYVEPENYTKQKEAELNADDLQISILNDAKIDINELVREQILLNLPEQSFCRKDCRGLCQQCGANRNLIDCNCIENEIDPRWSALKKLK